MHSRVQSHGQDAGLTQTNNAGHVFSTCSAAIFLARAPDQRGKRRSAVHIERPCPFWPMQLMGGNGEVIHAQLFHHKDRLTRQLNGIAVKQHAPRPADGGDLGNRPDYPGLVVCSH